jgi:uncharacterized protein YlxW (UPF0749 family)
MIPAFLLKFAAGIVGPKFAKAAVVGTAILLLVALLGLGKCAYDRHVISQHETKAALKQVKAERKADANLQTQVTRDDAAAQQRQQEITDATASIPDQRPSARQRAIACVELRREAQQRRKPVPAC